MYRNTASRNKSQFQAESEWKILHGRKTEKNTRLDQFYAKWIRKLLIYNTLNKHCCLFPPIGLNSQFYHTLLEHLPVRIPHTVPTKLSYPPPRPPVELWESLKRGERGCILSLFKETIFQNSINQLKILKTDFFVKNFSPAAITHVGGCLFNTICQKIYQWWGSLQGVIV